MNFVEDEERLAEVVGSRKKELAFSLGGMGSASTNFYNQAYSRQGWADVAAAVRERWQAGDREGRPPWSPTTWSSRRRSSARRAWCGTG